MLEILTNMVSVLINDTTLTAIVPSTNILTGPVDILEEKAVELVLPQINIHTISEVSRTVPSDVRDTLVQVDIWSRNSQLEIENIYERIITLLNYTNPTVGSARIFWQRLDGANDLYESDRRIWHRAMTYRAWSQKP